MNNYRSRRGELPTQIFKSLKVGLNITLIFTLISSLIMFRHMSLMRIWYAFLISGMYSFGIGTGCSLISMLLDWKIDWITQTRKRVFYGLITTLIYTTFVVLLVNYYRMVTIQGISTEAFWSASKIWQHLFYIILSLGIAVFFHAKGFMREWKHSVTLQNELEKENLASQYEALKSQIDPHFLFNSLNVLSSLVDEDTALAQKFINRLSHIYRYVLDQKDKELVCLEEELNFADQYIFLQKIRFEKGVTLNTHINYASHNYLTIPLALQILLENIFKHNAISDEKPIFIKIETQGDFLIVSNTINKKNTIQRSHNLGLDNIKARYKYFTDVDVIVEETPEQFCVKLPLIPN